MTIVPLNEIVEVNKSLNLSECNMKISFCDSCGGQSFRVKVVDNTLPHSVDTTKKIIVEYFSSKGYNPKFLEDDSSFIL